MQSGHLFAFVPMYRVLSLGEHADKTRRISRGARPQTGCASRSCHSELALGCNLHLPSRGVDESLKTLGLGIVRYLEYIVLLVCCCCNSSTTCIDVVTNRSIDTYYHQVVSIVAGSLPSRTI
jgi:hypothetical protein